MVSVVDQGDMREGSNPGHSLKIFFEYDRHIFFININKIVHFYQCKALKYNNHLWLGVVMFW